MKRILCVLMFTAVAAMAAAQQDFFHRPSPRAGRTLLTLSLFEEVRAELKTNDEFSAKTDGLLEKLQGEMQETFQKAIGDASSIWPSMEKLNAKYDEEIVKLLSVDQVARLKQLFIQFNGAAAITNPLISRDLEITDDQKAKIKTLQEQNVKRIAESFTNGDGPKDRQETMAKLQDDLNTALEHLLSEGQKAKFKTMVGARFEFKKLIAHGIL